MENTIVMIPITNKNEAIELLIINPGKSAPFTISTLSF